MERILELVKDAPELPKDQIYWLIDHACRVDKLSFKVSKSRAATLAYFKTLKRIGWVDYTRSLRYSSIDSKNSLQISEYRSVEAGGLFHHLCHDMSSSRDGPTSLIHGYNIPNRRRHTQHQCSQACDSGPRSRQRFHKKWTFCTDRISDFRLAGNICSKV